MAEKIDKDYKTTNLESLGLTFQHAQTLRDSLLLISTSPSPPRTVTHSYLIAEKRKLIFFESSSASYGGTKKLTKIKSERF